MIYMNTFEDLADKVRSAADCSIAARIIEDFVTEYVCSIAEKNEFNIANVTSSILPRLSQKSINEMIDKIKVNKGNLYHIAETGTINGSLREEIRKAISLFSLQEIIEALKLFGIEDPST